MKNYMLLMIFLLPYLSRFDCGPSQDAFKVGRFRIENTDVKHIFSTDPWPQKYQIIWEEDEIILSYFIPGKENEPVERVINFESEDGLIFQAANNLTAMVVRGGSPHPISWQEILDLEPQNGNNFTLVISESSENSEFQDMVYIPSGAFRMGGKWDTDEKPVHKVHIDAFYMDKFEITVRQFRHFCRVTRRKMPRQPVWNGDNHPVVMVSWDDATAYAKWAGKRLPTEAEWEYAAKSGDRNYNYGWGNSRPRGKRGGNIADEAIRSEKRGWTIWKGYYDGYVYTSPVGSFYTTLFGLHDITGNVKEWCSDWYQADYYKNSPAENPQGPKSGNRRVLRGGSWNYGPRAIRATNRYYYKSSLRLNHIGFRCVKDAE